MEAEMDILRQVYSADGCFMTVRPWPEGPDSVALMTVGKENEEYFGKYETAMSPEFARLLGKALIACADEIDSI